MLRERYGKAMHDQTAGKSAMCITGHNIAHAREKESALSPLDVLTSELQLRREEANKRNQIVSGRAHSRHSRLVKICSR